MRKFTLTIAAIAAIAASPVAGQQTDAVFVGRAAYGDLDLTSADGRRILARRIGQATEIACGNYAGVSEYYEIDAIDQCRQRAKAEVKRQVATIDSQQRTMSASR